MTTATIRKRVTPLLIAAVSVTLTTAWLRAAASEDSWERCRVLVERNMFMRGRRAPAPPHRGPIETPRAPTRPRFVLTGTARQKEAFVAFFEDAGTGKTIRARLGDTVGGALLKTITLDSVEHEANGTVTRIAIGESLTGETVVLPTRVTAAKPEAPPPAKPDEPEASGPEADKPSTEETPRTTQSADSPAMEPAGATDLNAILERMRQRRQQELNK